MNYITNHAAIFCAKHISSHRLVGNTLAAIVFQRLKKLFSNGCNLLVFFRLEKEIGKADIWNTVTVQQLLQITVFISYYYLNF